MAKSITDRQKRRLAKGHSFKEVWEEPTHLAAAFPARSLEQQALVIGYDLIRNVTTCLWSLDHSLQVELRAQDDSRNLAEVTEEISSN